MDNGFPFCRLQDEEEQKKTTRTMIAHLWPRQSPSSIMKTFFISFSFGMAWKKTRLRKRVKARQTGDGLFAVLDFILFNSLYTFWAVLFFTSFVILFSLLHFFQPFFLLLFLCLSLTDAHCLT